jgi:hypothetical protein
MATQLDYLPINLRGPAPRKIILPARSASYDGMDEAQAKKALVERVEALISTEHANWKTRQEYVKARRNNDQCGAAQNAWDNFRDLGQKRKRHQCGGTRRVRKV